MIASDVTDLPEPGLADDAEHLAGGEVEVDAADGRDDRRPRTGTRRAGRGR